MANSAHLVRRQSSRDLNPQRSLERLELKDVKTRIIAMEKSRSLSSYDKTSYGTTNAAFEDGDKTLSNVSKLLNLLDLVASIYRPYSGIESYICLLNCADSFSSFFHLILKCSIMLFQ